MSAHMGRIGIVGAGLGGLAAAVTLAGRGYEVVVFEANDWLGGKAAVLEEQGYRFDMGPTILTVPSVLARVFAEAGSTLEAELDLVRVDPQWRCFFDDGSTLDLVSDVNAMAERLDRFGSKADLGSGYRRFMALAERLHHVSNRFFFWRPVGRIADVFDWRTSLNLGVLSDVLSLRLGSSVAATVRSHVGDKRVAQMLDHFTQYVGSAPASSPAVLCAIAHMQTSEGVWYPRGGTAAVPGALARVARRRGVEFRMGVQVRRIVLDGSGAVIGVELEDDETVELGAVVSNADAVRTHQELLGGKPAQRFASRRRYEPACSGVVLYLGLSRKYDHLAHHNFIFSQNAEDEFRFIYHKGEPAPDPTCYVAATSSTDPATAPVGGEALYVLVHAPYLRPHHNWQTMFPSYRQVILDKLARDGGMPDLEKRIVVERWLTPQDIHNRYRVHQGAIYGLASHGLMSGAFKPNNRSPDVSRLYLAGGSAHPGPGMPMVLMSGWIAADALDRDGVVRKNVSVESNLQR